MVQCIISVMLWNSCGPVFGCCREHHQSPHPDMGISVGVILHKGAGLNGRIALHPASECFALCRR